MAFVSKFGLLGEFEVCMYMKFCGGVEIPSPGGTTTTIYTYERPTPINGYFHKVISDINNLNFIM